MQRKSPSPHQRIVHPPLGSAILAAAIFFGGCAVATPARKVPAQTAAQPGDLEARSRRAQEASLSLLEAIGPIPAGPPTSRAQPDRSLAAAAAELARHAAQEGSAARATDPDRVRLALSRAGSTAAQIHPLAVRATTLDAAIHRIRQSLPALLEGAEDFTHVGAAAWRAPDQEQTLVLLLTRSFAELDAIDPNPSPGSRLTIQGRLAPSLRAPELHLISPDGRPSRIPLAVATELVRDLPTEGLAAEVEHPHEPLVEATAAKTERPRQPPVEATAAKTERPREPPVEATAAKTERPRELLVEAPAAKTERPREPLVEALAAPPSTPASAGAVSFRGALLVDSPGRWILEVLGSGPSGPVVAAIQQLYVGIPIPGDTPPPAPAATSPMDPAEEERALAAAVNRLRARRGLGPLLVDPLLSRVARAYAEELRASGRLTHRSDRSGAVADRLHQAGYEFQAVGENLAQAGSGAEAQRSLEASPRHLQLLLGAQWREAGYGVAVREDPGGARSVILVQILTVPH